MYKYKIIVKDNEIKMTNKSFSNIITMQYENTKILSMTRSLSVTPDISISMAWWLAPEMTRILFHSGDFEVRSDNVSVTHFVKHLVASFILSQLA